MHQYWSHLSLILGFLCHPSAMAQADSAVPKPSVESALAPLLKGTTASEGEKKPSSPLTQTKQRGEALPMPESLFPEGNWMLSPQLPVLGLQTLSAAECSGCHSSVHSEWRSSGHAKAWSNPIYREALKAAGSPPACIQCHTPLLEQQAKKVVGYVRRDASRPITEPNDLFSPSLQQEGVTCAACHVRGGMIYGSRSLPMGRAPHPVTAHPDLKREELCAACHQLAFPGAESSPFYDTYGEWKGSRYAATGIGCIDCHMPFENGAGKGFAEGPSPHRSHRMAGGSDDAMLRRAITVEILPDKPIYSPGEKASITLRLINTGAGHAVPTTVPFRVIEARLAPDSEKAPLNNKPTLTLTRDMSPEPPFWEVKDRRLQVNGSVEAIKTIQIPKQTASGSYKIRLELTYHPLPPAALETSQGRVFETRIFELMVL